MARGSARPPHTVRFAAEGAAIAVERGDADQGRDLFAIEGAQFPK